MKILDIMSFWDRKFAKIRKRGSHLSHFDFKFEKKTSIFPISVCTGRKTLMNMENISVLKKKGSILYPKNQRFDRKRGVFKPKIQSQMQGPGSMYFVRKIRGDPDDKTI